MPASAGRVRMPHNNRMSTSAALKTTDIWSKTIGHDPYAGEDEKSKGLKNATADDEKARSVLAVARQQNLTDSANRDDFARKMYLGLRETKKKRRAGDHELTPVELAALERERIQNELALHNNDSSSEEELVEEEISGSDSSDNHSRKHKSKKSKERSRKHSKTRKKKSKKKSRNSSRHGSSSRQKKKSKSTSNSSDSSSTSSSSDFDDSSCSSEDHKVSRSNRKHSRSHSTHHKNSNRHSEKSSRRKRRRRFDDESTSDTSNRSKSRKRERTEKLKEKYDDDLINGNSDSHVLDSNEQLEMQDKKRVQPVVEFIPALRYLGSKMGYVFKKDYAGLGYYLDNYCCPSKPAHSKPVIGCERPI